MHTKFSVASSDVKQLANERWYTTPTCLILRNSLGMRLTNSSGNYVNVISSS